MNVGSKYPSSVTEHKKGTTMKKIPSPPSQRRAGVRRARTWPEPLPPPRLAHRPSMPPSQLQSQGFQVIEPGRLRCGEPVHAQRGSPWPDVLADRLRCAWSQRRPCHHRDQQDRLRRRHLLRPPVGEGRPSDHGGANARHRRGAGPRPPTAAERERLLRDAYDTLNQGLA